MNQGWFMHTLGSSGTAQIADQAVPTRLLEFSGGTVRVFSVGGCLLTE